MAGVTLRRAKELLDYDPATGEFTWKGRDIFTGAGAMFHLRYAGKVAGGRTFHLNGSPHDIQIMIDGKWRKAHRLAWLWMTGEWPEHLIDHINRDGHDNRWANLRPATKSTNAQNRRGAAAHSKSGVRGVWWERSRRKWIAEIKIENGKRIIQRFSTKEEAIAAVQAFRKLYFGEYAGE